MARVIAVVVILGLAAVSYQGLTRVMPDERLAELATKHAQQQAAQNERLSELQRQWQAERSELYQQRDQLEADRQQLAIDRQREPIIAQSIAQVGTLALALLPLAVCFLLLRRPAEPGDSEAVAETLVSDLMSANPQLIVPELPAADPDRRLGPTGSETSSQLEPPFP